MNHCAIEALVCGKIPTELNMRTTVLLIIAAAAALSMAACNTVSGAGKDVSSAGHAVTATANDAKK